MKAAFMTGIKNLEFRDIEKPVLGADDVLVAPEYVGICGSDVHYLEHGRIGDFVVEGDFILGHEFAGTITEVGANVDKSRVGERVCIEPGATCGKCKYCLSGNYNLCPDVEFFATPPFQGCFAEFVKTPANLAFKLPDNVSTKEGALVEPLSVGLEAASIGDVKIGSTVLVQGTGCIGLTAILASKARGATKIIVSDVFDNRLAKAKELGADFTINAANKNIIEEVNKLTNGEGVDVIIETAGVVATTQQTVDLVARGGTIVLVGLAPAANFEFDFGKLMGKVANIRTIFRYKNQYPVAIEAISSGAIDVSKVVTHEYNFDELPEAFRVNIEDKANVVKAVVKI